VKCTFRTDFDPHPEVNGPFARLPYLDSSRKRPVQNPGRRAPWMTATMRSSLRRTKNAIG